MPANLITPASQSAVGPLCEPSITGLFSESFDPQEQPEEPSDLEPAEPSDLEYIDIPCTDEDSRWDVFLPDDNERDPLPDVGDFWVEQSQGSRAESRGPEF